MKTNSLKRSLSRKLSQMNEKKRLRRETSFVKRKNGKKQRDSRTE
jgi:hypothetical protein